MNKRISIFYIVTVIVAVACLILDLALPNDKFSFLGICFSITMLAYGLCLIFRGLTFKIDSSLFLGIIIFVFGVISVMADFTKWGYFDLWHFILLGASGASLITGVYFKVKAQKKLSVLFLILFAIAFCFQNLHLFKWWVMSLMMLGAIVMFIVVNNIWVNRRK